MQENLRRRQTFFILSGVILIFIIRVGSIFFTDNYEIDGISRVWNVEDLFMRPQRLLYGTWGSIFYILFSPLLLLSKNIEFPARILSVIFSVGTLGILAFYIRRVFGMRIALLTLLIGGVHPLGTYCSTLTIAGNPFSFFFLAGFFAVHRSLEERSKKWAIIGGVFFTLASGIRFENWFSTFFLTVFFLYHHQWKNGLWFLGFALLFPIFWSTSSYLSLGDPFFSFTISHKSLSVLDPMQHSILKERFITYLNLLASSLGKVFLLFSFLGFYFSPKKRELVPLFFVFVYYSFLHVGGVASNTMLNIKRYLLIPHLVLIPYVAFLINGLISLEQSHFKKNG